jgi:hypothetical protein
VVLTQGDSHGYVKSQLIHKVNLIAQNGVHYIDSLGRCFFFVFCFFKSARSCVDG